ncbi:hydroxyethylthiazole kinase [Aeromicrobium endophyticum]|uniref:Hydroxyethylthiazole kinase n=1 Tax=Aeromicrobium endophyticum TaxID=2292704 RepID=A0A371P184_9ACTN|nr:hydroxyethylthiazole kinase [Aeromicrobium endophyticum]REK69697.1 hydroxyethylthiazole kinase [Aeromicrobium endophyticum]
MSSTVTSATPSIVAAVRAQSPLVQYLTNFVSMDVAANVLNAVGASPAMVHDPHESGEFARLASAVGVNIGTPSPPWVEGMIEAARAAHEVGTPWVLDPVAVGATSYRRRIVAQLLEHRPTVVRGNASEILAIATSQAGGRGVDSDASSSDAVEAARELARDLQAVVVVTGVEDVVTDGARTAIVHGGHPWMPMVTALGCSATALVAACCAVEEDAVEAAVAAMVMLSVAGERAGARAAGPGSFRVALLDELAALDDVRVASARVDRS